MKINKRSGFTFIENLVAIVLVSILVISMIGGFVISKAGAIRAQHKTVAMGLIREYMNKEVASGYYFGQYFTFADANPVTAVIGGITYSIAPDPYPAADSIEGSIHYKTIGFRVTWNEPVYGLAGSVQCSERMATYIAKHS